MFRADISAARGARRHEGQRSVGWLVWLLNARGCYGDGTEVGKGCLEGSSVCSPSKGDDVLRAVWSFLTRIVTRRMSARDFVNHTLIREYIALDYFLCYFVGASNVPCKKQSASSRVKLNHFTEKRFPPQRPIIVSVLAMIFANMLDVIFTLFDREASRTN